MLPRSFSVVEGDTTYKDIFTPYIWTNINSIKSKVKIHKKRKKNTPGNSDIGIHRKKFPDTAEKGGSYWFEGAGIMIRAIRLLNV